MGLHIGDEAPDFTAETTAGEIRFGEIRFHEWQLDAVYEHGLAYARSQAFYDTTTVWQWLRLPGDVVFAAGALLMAWDFVVKLRPLFPNFGGRHILGSHGLSQ